MQNWYKGNDYLDGTLYKDKADTQAEVTENDWRGGVRLNEIAAAEKDAVGFYFFMKNNRTTAWDTHYLHNDDALNMMDTKHGLAKFPYIRGTRRIIGLNKFRLGERYFVESNNGQGTSFRFYDSVGIGNYAVDVHPTYFSSGIVGSFHNPLPFYIPYRSLGSDNVRNLLSAGKTLATTFLTNAGYRLHPIEWAIGSAAGGAAAIMARDEMTNYDLLELEKLRELQNNVAANSPIHWKAYDNQIIPPKNGDLVINDFKQVTSTTAVEVEAYYHKGTRAELLASDLKIAATDTYANGRFRFDDVRFPRGTVTATVIIYDGDSEIDRLTTVIEVEGPLGSTFIIDDADAGFSFTGTWEFRGADHAQPGKYGDTYRFAWGNVELSTATWAFTVPAAGSYRLSTQFAPSTNRATDAPFRIVHADGETVVRIDQSNNLALSQWIELGTFRFESTGSVVLTNEINDQADLVVADAIRLESLEPITEAEGWVIY
jgi:hypothetical protein